MSKIIPPQFEKVDFNKDGVADFAEMTAWVLDKQNSKDINALMHHRCLAEHIEKKGTRGGNKLAENQKLTRTQRKRLHALVNHYSTPMVLSQKTTCMVYPTTRTDTLHNPDAQAISPHPFKDKMMNYQNNGKLDIEDVLYHFIFSNKSYDMKNNNRFPDEYSGYKGDENGWGGFNKAQWNKLFFPIV